MIKAWELIKGIQEGTYSDDDVFLDSFGFYVKVKTIANFRSLVWVDTEQEITITKIVRRTYKLVDKC